MYQSEAFVISHRISTLFPLLSTESNRKLSRPVMSSDSDHANFTDDGENQLQIQNIFDKDDESSADEKIERQPGTHQRLTSLVRQQYYSFLEKTLRNNYRNSADSEKCEDAEADEKALQTLAIRLERKALKSCMVFTLYQNAMLTTIQDVRQHTAARCLYEKDKLMKGMRMAGKKVPIDGSNSTNGPQLGLGTDSGHNRELERPEVQQFPRAEAEPKLSLDDRINEFQERLRVEEKNIRMISGRLKRSDAPEQDVDPKRAKIAPKLTPIPYQPPIITKTEPKDEVSSEESDDIIAKEMSKLFSETDGAELDIFCDSKNPQIEAIIMEINRFNPETLVNAPMGVSSLSDGILNGPTSSVHSPGTFTTLDLKDNLLQDNLLQDNLIQDNSLKDSIWPCELHMQRMKLREVLSAVAEKGMRYSAKIRRRFGELFGPEGTEGDFDEDYEGPYSPTIELADPVLIGSCLKRIAPWVVQELMGPMQQGLIANRYLFKKLAKHIAERALLETPYPGEGWDLFMGIAFELKINVIYFSKLVQFCSFLKIVNF